MSPKKSRSVRNPLFKKLGCKECIICNYGYFGKKCPQCAFDNSLRMARWVEEYDYKRWGPEPWRSRVVNRKKRAKLRKEDFSIPKKSKGKRKPVVRKKIEKVAPPPSRYDKLYERMKLPEI